MLSYLRDPNVGETPAEQQTAEVLKQEQKYLTVASHKDAVRRSTTMLCVFFIIGLICLGIMIKKSSPKAAIAKTNNTQELQIESAITRLTGIKSEMFNRMDEIVSKFYEYSNVFQVQVSELVKNPFQIESIIENLKNESDNKDSQITAEMIYKEQIKRKAKNLKLYSIMQSEKGTCCMIDNNILYEGDKIQDFEVKKISIDNVQLDLDGIEITLNLSK